MKTKLPRIIKPMENVDDLAVLLAYNSSKSKGYGYKRGKYGTITIYLEDKNFVRYRIEQKIYEALFGQGKLF